MGSIWAFFFCYAYALKCLPAHLAPGRTGTAGARALGGISGSLGAARHPASQITLVEAYCKICLSKDVYLTAGCGSGCCFERSNRCLVLGSEELRDAAVFTEPSHTHHASKTLGNDN